MTTDAPPPRLRAQQHEGRHDDRSAGPLTYAEKVLFSHLDDPEHGGLERGVDYTDYRPDRVAMQDATAQMAILQFMTAGLPEVAVPTTVHCDHLIQAHVGADADLTIANEANREVYDFLSSASQKYGMGFWKPGSGIIHQVVLENYAFPGGMMIGTDSHTPNAGGLGMVAIGVGRRGRRRRDGLDAVEPQGPEADRRPPHRGALRLDRLQGRHPQGRRDPHRQGRHRRHRRVLRAGRDLHLRDRQGHDHQHGRRDRRDHLAVPLRREHGRLPQGHGARGGRRPRRPLRVVPAARRRGARRPHAYYDQVIEIDLSTLEPHLVGPHTPDLARPLSELKDEALQQEYPIEISQSLVGSCTNSSYEDITRAASIARQASAKGITARSPLLITPGSEQVRATIERDGLLADLEAIGATVLANACGPCIGQWKRDDIEAGERNTIVTSFNRNFPKRNDGNAETLAFIGSPETVVAMALSGRLDFDPRRDALVAEDGTELRLTEPVGEELPSSFDRGDDVFVPPVEGEDVEVVVAPESERLQLLEPFPAWDGEDLTDLPVLLKAQGKCTTDHISMAGPWLRFRGHLENISGNLFLSADNAWWTVPATASTSRRPVATARRSWPCPSSPSAGTSVARTGSPSATRTTARAARGSTPPWSRASAAAAR
jgi:aconitate hydratase